MFALEPFEAEYGRHMTSVKTVQVMGYLQYQERDGMTAREFLFMREDGTFDTDDIEEFTAKLVWLDTKEIDSEEE